MAGDSNLRQMETGLNGCSLSVRFSVNYPVELRAN